MKVVNRRESDRLGVVFEVLAGLLVVAQLLATLPLQVPLQDLLHQERVGPFGPQEHIVGRHSLEHFKYIKEHLTYWLVSVFKIVSKF